MAYCSNCGSASPPYAHFCPMCGARQEAPREQTVTSYSGAPTRQTPPRTAKPGGESAYETLVFPPLTGETVVVSNIEQKRVRTGDKVYLLAPLGRRVVAFLIDCGVLLFAFAVFDWIANATKTTDYYGNQHYSPAVKVLLVILTVGWILGLFTYWWLQEASSHNATLGKRIMGLRVVRTDGTPPSFWQAAARSFGHWLSFCFWALGYWWAFWDSAHQTWHDKIAKTIVVDARTQPEGG